MLEKNSILPLCTAEEKHNPLNSFFNSHIMLFFLDNWVGGERKWYGKHISILTNFSAPNTLTWHFVTCAVESAPLQRQPPSPWNLSGWLHEGHKIVVKYPIHIDWDGVKGKTIVHDYHSDVAGTLQKEAFACSYSLQMSIPQSLVQGKFHSTQFY
jgi:hypothetical protein